jgi:hypothetical protein
MHNSAHTYTTAFTLLFPLIWIACQPQPSGPQFDDPIPASSSTTIPEQIYDDYWHSEFERVNKEVRAADGCQLAFFGDSITLRWSGAKAEGQVVWGEKFAKYRPINMGNSGDITPVMLYRVTHGNLDFPEGQAPRVAVLLCGTNNYVVTKSDGGNVQWDLGIETPPGEVADGIRAVAQVFHRKLPTTRLIVLGILPVKNQAKWEKCRQTNAILSTYNYPKDEVVFLDLEDHFLNEQGTILPDLFLDGTHLTPDGYAVLAEALLPQIERLIEMGPIPTR